MLPASRTGCARACHEGECAPGTGNADAPRQVERPRTRVQQAFDGAQVARAEPLPRAAGGLQRPGVRERPCEFRNSRLEERSGREAHRGPGPRGHPGLPRCPAIGGPRGGPAPPPPPPPRTRRGAARRSTPAGAVPSMAPTRCGFGCAGDAGPRSKGRTAAAADGTGGSARPRSAVRPAGASAAAPAAGRARPGPVGTARLASCRTRPGGLPRASGSSGTVSAWSSAVCATRRTDASVSRAASAKAPYRACLAAASSEAPPGPRPVPSDLGGDDGDRDAKPAGQPSDICRVGPRLAAAQTVVDVDGVRAEVDPAPHRGARREQRDRVRASRHADQCRTAREDAFPACQEPADVLFERVEGRRHRAWDQAPDGSTTPSRWWVWFEARSTKLPAAGSPPGPRRHASELMPAGSWRSRP